MENRLEEFLAFHALDPVEAMNRLQAVGIISDNCILASDVADADCERAVLWLRVGLDPSKKLPSSKP